jgi:transposase
LNFLKEIDAQVPDGLDVHIVMDNYATHKTPKIKAWLARRPHYHMHFTPTSASWINQVERWFAELTRKRLRRGVHTSVRQVDIRAFVDRHNQNPQALQMDHVRRPNTRLGQALLPKDTEHIMHRTLDSHD